MQLRQCLRVHKRRREDFSVAREWEMKKFDIKKVNWKKVAIQAAALLVVALLISELFSLHADTITVKYVADIETYRSNSVGGYTEAVVSKEKRVIRDWIKLFEKITRDGEKAETRLLSEAFPGYIMEFRQGSIMVQRLIVTPERVGVFNWLTGSYVLEFSEGNPYYEVVKERMEAQMNSR